MPDAVAGRQHAAAGGSLVRRQRCDAASDDDAGEWEAIKELVAAGLGCAVVPGMAMRRDGGARSSATKSLVVRPLAEAAPHAGGGDPPRQRPLHKG